MTKSNTTIELTGMTGRLYPNQAQIEQIRQAHGSTRFVWNQFLDMLSTRYQNNPSLAMPSFTAMSTMLTQLKREHVWLKETDSIALQNSIKALREAFERFFNKTSKHPKFKSKRDAYPSYRTTIRNVQAQSHGNIRFDNMRGQRFVKLPKLGWVKCRMSITHIENEHIKAVTIKQLPTGHYQISVLVESDSQTLDKTGSSVGVDLGVSDLAILSDGRRYKSLKLYNKYKSELHRWQVKANRRLRLAKSRGVELEDAKNYQKARVMVAKIHAKMANTRKNYLHHMTTELVECYDVICIEDLKPSNLMKNHSLARAIAEQSWRELRLMLEYKCKRYGKTLIAVNPYKTSQYCSSCGHDGGKKELNIRAWQCTACSVHHDRDINAARNILNIGSGSALVT